MTTRAAVRVLMLLPLAVLTAAPPNEPIQPFAPAVVSNAAMVEFGKKLYFDPRSRAKDLKEQAGGCATCHNGPAAGG